jgi:hypothetical protein
LLTGTDDPSLPKGGSEMAKDDIFFGIGAQKAGTTWLYQVLGAYPDCAPLPVKEMHFFDRKYSVEPRSLRTLQEDFDRLVHLAKRLSERVEIELEGYEGGIYGDGFLADAKLEAKVDRIVRLAERLGVADSASYVRYVENWRSRAGGRLIGEITPAYSTLPVEGFAEMNRLYPKARYIFIMRDPIGRYWSQLRFWLSQRGSDANPNAEVARTLRRKDFLIRSDYKRTIEALEQVIPRDRIHYAFFEHMVSKERTVDELRRLEAFLGLSRLDAATALRFVEEPANVSPKTPMLAETRALLLRELTPTYAFVRERFGNVPASWTQIG